MPKNQGSTRVFNVKWNVWVTIFHFLPLLTLLHFLFMKLIHILLFSSTNSIVLFCPSHSHVVFDPNFNKTWSIFVTIQKLNQVIITAKNPNNIILKAFQGYINQTLTPQHLTIIMKKFVIIFTNISHYYPLKLILWRKRNNKSRTKTIISLVKKIFFWNYTNF